MNEKTTVHFVDGESLQEKLERIEPLDPPEYGRNI